MNLHPAGGAGRIHKLGERLPARGGDRHRHRAAHRLGEHEPGGTEAQAGGAVVFVATGLRRDGHVHVAVLGASPCAVLVLLDSGHVDQERYRRHIVEVESWRTCRLTIPTQIEERREPRFEVESLRKVSTSRARVGCHGSAPMNPRPRVSGPVHTMAATSRPDIAMPQVIERAVVIPPSCKCPSANGVTDPIAAPT